MAKLVLKAKGRWVRRGGYLTRKVGPFLLEVTPTGYESGSHYWAVQFADVTWDDLRSGKSKTEELAIAAAEAALLEEIGKVVEIEGDPK